MSDLVCFCVKEYLRILHSLLGTPSTGRTHPFPCSRATKTLLGSKSLPVLVCVETTLQATALCAFYTPARGLVDPTLRVCSRGWKLVAMEAGPCSAVCQLRAVARQRGLPLRLSWRLLVQTWRLGAPLPQKVLRTHA